MSKRILIMTDSIGRGDAELGRDLMRKFLYALAGSDVKPLAIMFANEGVRLACEGSDVLDDLQLLEEDGVMIRSCGTCLDYLDITEELRIGAIGTVPDMVGALLTDDEVVTIA